MGRRAPGRAARRAHGRARPVGVSLLLDTSVLVSGLAGSDGDADAALAAIDAPWSVSVVSVGELEDEAGVLLARGARRRADRLRRLTAVLSAAPLLPADRLVAARYGELRAASGRRPSNDLWIAATALAHDLTLVTLDATQAALPWSAPGAHPADGGSCPLATLPDVTPRLADLPLLAAGRSASVRPRRPPADGRDRPDLDVRRGSSDADPGQGQGADGPVGLLVRAARRDRAEPPPLVRPTACPTRRRARARRAASCSMLRSSASCAGTSPGRAGRTTWRPARSRASRCRPVCRSPSSCPSRSSRRARRRRSATTRRSTSTRPPRSGATAR